MVEIGHQSGTQALFKTFVVLLKPQTTLLLLAASRTVFGLQSAATTFRPLHEAELQASLGNFHPRSVSHAFPQ